MFDPTKCRVKWTRIEGAMLNFRPGEKQVCQLIVWIDRNFLVRVEQPDDLLVFRGYRATRSVLEGVKRRSGRVGVEVLAKRVGGNGSVVGFKEVTKIDAEGVQSLVGPLVK